MEYRPLGNTGLNVSVVSLGVEYLKNEPEEVVEEILDTAIKNGINYVDLVWSLPYLIKKIANGVLDRRDRVQYAVHLGSCYKEDKYQRSRSPKRCEETFRNTLSLLNTDYADIINLHYIHLREWEKISKPSGLIDLAIKLRDEGSGKVIGISTHELEVVKLAAEHPEIQSVMYQINMTNHHLNNRDNILQLCKDNGMGIVAMKPYAKGKLLKANRKQKISIYQSGGVKFETKMPKTMTPPKCLSYTLNQIGVSCAVTGVKSVEELHGGLSYLKCSETEKKYNNELVQIFS